ncbi:alpha-ketoacid dehydrogenase subunit beta [Candidatus Micrarchaeota archaeon]|nr:alpha-ketoacid dehydrogenase subunit beta [Candidatus Micrarchaeota archaeon]
MLEITLINAINQSLDQEMERDANAIVLGEDVGLNGGVFRATEGLQKKYGPARVIDTPLAESSIIGCSIGLALAGFRPVAEIQFAGFIYVAMNQLVNHLARIRNRTQGKLNMPIVIRAPCSGGIRALEHHSESMEALYAHVPGLKVVIPSTPYDAKGLLASSIRDNDPVIFLEPSKFYRAFRQEVPEKPYTVPLGEAAVRQEGEDVTLVAWGSVVKASLDAAAQSGKSVEVIDLRSIVPWDKKKVLESVEKTGRLVVVHEAPHTGGFGAEISATVSEEGIFHLKGPVLRVTGYDTAVPLAKREDYYIPNAQRISKAIIKACES